MKTPIPRLLTTLAALSVGGLAPFCATAQTTIGELFSDNARSIFGDPAGTLDTDVKRSGTASFRVEYTSDFSTHGIEFTESTLTAGEITQYAGEGWFELYYRSTKAGTIRFIALDAGHQFMM